MDYKILFEKIKGYYELKYNVKKDVRNFYLV
jgi:hypothetical protein